MHFKYLWTGKDKQSFLWSVMAALPLTHSNHTYKHDGYDKLSFHLDITLSGGFVNIFKQDACQLGHFRVFTTASVFGECNRILYKDFGEARISMGQDIYTRLHRTCPPSYCCQAVVGQSKSVRGISDSKPGATQSEDLAHHAPKD